MGISSPGIGSNLDINSIVAKLMQAETRPLAALAKKEASYQAKLSAFGTLSGSMSSLQGALNSLNNLSTFTGVNATPADTSIFGATATSSATVGTYNINVTQLAQAQTISSRGRTSTTATIGTGASTTLTFQFGTISGGSFVAPGTKLNSSIAASGIPANSLSINGTTITTSGTTTSAKALADQINAATATTNVSATAQTDSGELGVFTTTSAPGYSLTVGGVSIISNAGAPVTAADVDTAIGLAGLGAAGITVSGSAATNDLKFTKADGTNLVIEESGAVTGGFTSSVGIGATKTFVGSVSLSSASAITIGGSNPAVAGFTAGNSGPYTFSGASFSLDPNVSSGSVTIDNTNNSLQGIRDAINKAKLGVTASIVSDGSATPNHLVLTSNKTGLTSSMKVSVSGDATLAGLLSYDPAGTQNMTQSVAAQNASLSVNGLAVSSTSNSVASAIEGVTLDLAKVGSSKLTIAQNTAAVTSAVNAFVKAYNDLNATIKKTTGYDEATKTAGILLGDSSVRNMQAQLRKMMASPISDPSGSLTTLSQVGISIDKTGTMSVDSTKLSAAMSKSLNDVAALFSSFGSSTDSLVKYSASTSATKPGSYAVYLTTLATQGKVAGSNVVGATIIDNSNKDLSLTVDGVTASVSLATGSYTADTLITQVQSAINSASSLSTAGIAVSVTLDVTGKMVITSNKYGSTSKVSISGSGVATLMGTATATDGADVQGTIGGIAGTGSGQFLTGAAGSSAEGLKLEITGGVEGAARGTLTFSRGYAHQLNGLVDGFLGTDGVISGRTDGLKRTIKDIGKQNETLNARLADIEARYRKQFTALDTLIGKMNTTSTYLTQQLAQISKMSSE